MKIFEQENETENWKIACQGLQQFDYSEGRITSLTGTSDKDFFDILSEDIKDKGFLVKDDLMFRYRFTDRNDKQYNIEFYFEAEFNYDITKEDSPDLWHEGIPGGEEEGIINTRNVNVADILIYPPEEDELPFWEINYDDPEWQNFFKWCIEGEEILDDIEDHIEEELEEELN